MKMSILANALLAAMFLFSSCHKDSASQTPTVPKVYFKIYGGTSFHIGSGYVVITGALYPDHKSPYWPAYLAEHEDYNGPNANFQQNGYLIKQGGNTYAFPSHPTKATNHLPTPNGPIGISLNGMALYSQLSDDNNGSLLTPSEINSFDQYNGHTLSTGEYHYHFEPLYLTTTKGKDALLGFILDGFPVYGPLENGKTLTSSDLDEFHGHISTTADYPSGIYHYHITSDAPYIVGNGFYGTPGTVEVPN